MGRRRAHRSAHLERVQPADRCLRSGELAPTITGRAFLADELVRANAWKGIMSLHSFGMRRGEEPVVSFARSVSRPAVSARCVAAVLIATAAACLGLSLQASAAEGD